MFNQLKPPFRFKLLRTVWCIRRPHFMEFGET